MNDSPLERHRFAAPLDEVDTICDAFEAAWLGGDEPRIEDFLLRGDVSHQDRLLRELLLAEWDLRRRHGQPTELEPYLARFAVSNLPITELWRAWQKRISGGGTDDPASRFEMTRDRTCLEERGRLIDRYKLLEKVGEGGFGTVWAAEQREPVKRRVALKIIKLGMDTKQVVARFEAERQALAFMDHPNIAKVFDGGTTQCGRPYFVMELVRGIPITAYCEQERLGIRTRLDLFLKVCHAIQHAHQKGIIHRDIKPSNILVTLHDGVPVPKVIDFGIAKATQQELTEKTIYTQLQQFIGTPAYMSPEQAELSGLDVDTRSDIYSLGVLLYELLTGLTPFDANELVRSGLDEMRRIIREREPLRPSSRLTQQLETARRSATNATSLAVVHPVPHTTIDRDLDWIVMKCLEKDRTRRYTTANGLATEIGRYLNHEPVEARPPSAAYRVRKAWQRNKTTCTAIASVFLALTAGLSLAALGWRQARTQRDEAYLARAGEEIQRKQAQAQKQQAILAREEARRRAYVAEISAAFHALDENSLARAIELRDHWWPRPGEEDLRGFEWRLLWQLCQSDAADSLPEGARHIRFSPDGKWLAYSADEKIVLRAWPSRNVVKEIAFGGALLDFSPDSQRLAGAIDGELKVWSTESWQEVKTVKPPERVRNPIVFSPQGKWLVTGAQPKGYRVWNTETWEGGPPFGDELLRRWVENTSVAFSPDGTLLVTPGHPEGRESSNQFQVWEFPSLKHRGNFEPFPGRLSCAAFAPDGKHLLTGTGEGLLLVWDVTAGRIVKRIKAHTGWTWSIATARDGSTFVTSGADRTLALWDAATYEPLVRLRGHLRQIASVAMSADGTTLLSGSDDGTMKFWDTQTRHTQPELPNGMYAVGFSADSRRLVAAGYRKHSLWNLEDGTSQGIPVQNYDKLLEHRGFIEIGSTSRDAHGTLPLAAFGMNDGLVEIWDTADMACVSSWRAGDGDVRTVVFAPSGEFIATGDDKGEVVLWETSTGREVKRFEPMGAALRCLAFSPDGELLAGSDIDSSLTLWDVRTGEILKTRELINNPAISVAFGPNEKLLLTSGGGNETGEIWEVPSLAPWGALTGHAQPLFGTFSPDGKTIATCSDDCSLRLWNVATRQEMVNIDLPGGGRSVKFSPDGRSLAVGYLLEPQEHIRLWTVPSIEEIDRSGSR
jgi:WD40 repeat protein/serine/threonine protein kinase